MFEGVLTVLGWDLVLLIPKAALRKFPTHNSIALRHEIAAVFLSRKSFDDSFLSLIGSTANGRYSLVHCFLVTKLPHLFLE